MTSTALTIAARFDNDGQRFTDSDGVHIRVVCNDVAINRSDMRGSTVWWFADGSFIALTEGGWDVVVPYLTGWASADDNGNPNPNAWTFGV